MVTCEFYFILRKVALLNNVAGFLNFQGQLREVLDTKSQHLKVMDHRNQPGMNQKPKSRSQTYRTSKRKH